MPIYIPSLLFPRKVEDLSSFAAVIVARGPLRTYRSIDMSRTKEWQRKAKETAAAAKAGVTLEEWRAANPRPTKQTKAAGSGAYLRNRSLEEQAYLERHRSKSTGAGSDMGEPSPSGIHAAHVALERDGFVVLRPRGERRVDRRYEIPVYPQRDLGQVFESARKELGLGLTPQGDDKRRVQALVDERISSHTSISIHDDGPIDWGAAVSEIWGHYHATLTDAASKGISAEQLTTYDPEEKLAAQFPGFQPRFGGRIDMDIPFDDDHGNHGNTSLGRAAHQLEKTVKKFLQGGVGTNEPANTVRHIKDENGRFGLGVVVSRPGDAIQNWHQDGDSLGEDAGKTYIAFMTASRVALARAGGRKLGMKTALPGPLQIIKGSHKVNATPGLSEGELPTQLRGKHEGKSYLFEADEPGTICVMNYRCWHRGLANTSAHLMRPVLYMRFEVKWGDPPNGRPRIYPPESKRKGLTPIEDPTKKRRVTPTQLPCSVEELEPRGEVS